MNKLSLSENISDIVKNSFLSKDLKSIQKTDVKKGLRNGVIRLLGLLPIAGDVAEGAIDIALDIRDATFFRNFIAYLFELKDCTDVDREKFLDEVEEAAKDYSGNVIAGMISRIDNINKGMLLANLTKAKMAKSISIEDFFRLTAVTERIPFPDFKYLAEFVEKNYVPGGVSELLLSAGVISQTSIDENENHDWFELSPIGTKLMKYGFGTNVEIKDRTKMEIPMYESADDMEFWISHL